MQCGGSGYPPAMATTTNCSKCQSSHTFSPVLGDASLGAKGGGMISATIKVELHATACLDCGHVDLSADPAKLKSLAAVS